MIQKIKEKLVFAIVFVLAFMLILNGKFPLHILAITGEINTLGISEIITYSTDNKTAILSLDKTKFDINTYEIKQILGPKGEELSLASPMVTVDKNDDYVFTIKYLDKHSLQNENINDTVIEGNETKEEKPVMPNDISLQSIEITFKVNEIGSSETDKTVMPNNVTTLDVHSQTSNASLAKSNSTIDLNGQFNVSAYASNYSNDKGKDISDLILNKINGNYIMSTVAGNGAYQGTSLTSKSTIDFSYDFVMKGVSNQPAFGDGDGFLFAFHNNPDYGYGGGYSSNIAFYNNNDSGFQGDALVLEADPYNNYDRPVLGDYALYNTTHSHLNILQMDKTNPKAPQRLAENIVTYDNLVGMQQFEISWVVATKTISLNVNGKTVSYSNFDVDNVFGSSKLYYTIGVATGRSGINGFNSEFRYDEFSYTGLEANGETTYTKKVENDQEIKLATQPSADLTNYAKPGDTVHVVHKMWNDLENANDYVEKVSIFRSMLGNEVMIPITGTLKTYSDRNKTKIDINDNILYGEYIDINFIPKDEGAVYLEYDVKLSEIVLGNYDFESSVIIGQRGMTQEVFSSNAKVAGNPILKDVVDLDLAIDDSVIASSQVIKQGIIGHTFDTTYDEDLSDDKINLKLDYAIKDMEGNTTTTIPMHEPGMYKVDYTLTDTRTNSNLKSSASRYIRISNKHTTENGIAILAKDITINEVELRQHEVDLIEYLKTELQIKAYWVANGIEAVNFSIDLQGLSHNSKAKDTPYKVKIMAEKDGKTAVLEADVMVTPDVMGFLEIPSHVNLYDAGGIDIDHAGASVYIKLADGITPGVVYDIKAETDFDIRNMSGESFVVSLYDNKKTLFAKDSEGKAILGSIDGNNRTKQIWYNILKDPNRDVSTYEGTMTFYLSASKENG